jgi:hypothetical protein
MESEQKATAWAVSAEKARVALSMFNNEQARTYKASQQNSTLDVSNVFNHHAKQLTPVAPQSPSRRHILPSMRPVSPSMRPISPSLRPVSPSMRPVSPSVSPSVSFKAALNPMPPWTLDRFPNKMKATADGVISTFYPPLIVFVARAVTQSSNSHH